MNLNIDPNWLRRMAEKEDNRIVSVGGFFTRSAEEEAEASEPFYWWHSSCEFIDIGVKKNGRMRRLLSFNGSGVHLEFGNVSHPNEQTLNLIANYLWIAKALLNEDKRLAILTNPDLVEISELLFDGCNLGFRVTKLPPS